MSRAVIGVALAAVGIALWAETPLAQSPSSPPADPAPTAPLLTRNPTFQASLDRIATGSALWRDALEEVRLKGRHALIVTSDKVLVADTPGKRGTEAFDETVLAEVAPVPHDDSQVHVVLVVVNLALLENIHRERRSLPSEFNADLDRILVHEIYGHALPYLQAGDLSGRCADPTPDQRASDACSIRRENAVRAELGLGRRSSYGLDSLALARRVSR